MAESRLTVRFLAWVDNGTVPLSLSPFSGILLVLTPACQTNSFQWLRVWALVLGLWGVFLIAPI